MVFIICMLVFRWAGSNSWNSINGFNSEAKKYRCERKFHLEKNGVNESKYLTQKMNYFQRKWHSEVGKKLSVNLCITWTFLWLQLGFCFTAEMQQRHNTVLFWKKKQFVSVFSSFSKYLCTAYPKTSSLRKKCETERGETRKIYGTGQRLTPLVNVNLIINQPLFGICYILQLWQRLTPLVSKSMSTSVGRPCKESLMSA